ncbi:MAG: TRAP transporter large permease subunit [Verrucomicrobia bacterium]|nr:TRAP transporter large permease subunit [Verrucomicrobiota bacterium]MBM3870023.1 TRAP transporter large permease subunit [Verrucomicrobiota bacterium]
MLVTAAAAESVPATGLRARLRQAENLLLSVVLITLIGMPLLEAFLRKAFQVGIPGATVLVQHFTLIIGMLGGALAARDSRLLAMSALPTILPEKGKLFAALFSGTIATTVALFLTVAGVEFVKTEKESGNFLVSTVPIWWVQVITPIGFALVTGRLLWNASPQWWGRLVVFVASGLLVWLATHPPTDPAKLVWPAIATLIAATVLGAPIFVTLGGAAMILFWGEDLPIVAVAIDHYRLVTNPTLPTIPLFTLAGYLLAEGGASKRLVAVFQSLFGSFRGGPAIVTALVCTFFTSFTGASGVTILAMGGLLMPVMLAARYSERNALGLLTGSGALGLLFPPSLPLILYAIIAGSKAQAAGVTIEKMFLAALLPGLLLVALTAWWGVSRGPKGEANRPTFNGAAARAALWEAKWELAVPFVALIALFGGFATPVEAAAVTALYVFIATVFIHRDLKLTADIPRVLTECGLLVGGVLMILGVALGLTNYLVDAQIPAKAVEWVTASIKSKWAFLLALNLLLLLVGCFMDVLSAIVVIVPLLVPLGSAFGIDPLHLGIIFLANMELGLLAPTVGINIFLASYRFKKPVMEVSRAVLPMQGVLIIGVLLITYFPPLTTWLPKLFGK